MKSMINVLIIEDNPGDARLIREMLSGPPIYGAPYRLAYAENMAKAERSLDTEAFDVILLDLNLPDSTGLETLERLTDLNPNTAIIVLTGLKDTDLTARAVQKGAQDYLVKDELDSHILERVIHYAIERKRTEEKYRHLATHDPLTGLPNRVLLYDRLEQAIKRSQRIQRNEVTKWKAGVLLMDLTNFKQINDTYGHEAGDLVLKGVARRLESCLRHIDTVARLGGDEFVLVVEGVLARTDCETIARKLIEVLNIPLILNGLVAQISASIGISLFPDDAEDIDTLIRFADSAMYNAKRQNNHVHSRWDQ